VPCTICCVGGVAESVRGSEVESWVHEAQIDSAEVSRVLEETRISITSSSSRRAYSAYADEPLTSAHDIVDTMWLASSRY
jgi:hypothetical protein